MLVLTFSPFATVWLWFPPHSVGLQSPIPAFTFVLTFSPRDIVWLCWSDIPPAFTFVLTFIEFFLSLSLIAAGCRLLIQAKKECEIAGWEKCFFASGPVARKHVERVRFFLKCANSPKGYCHCFLPSALPEPERHRSG